MAGMSEPAGRDPIYREPPALARLFVYGFALVSPLLALSALLIPAAVLVRTGTDAGGIAVASCVTLVYVLLLAAAVRGVRRLAARFTPPLPLPGDIWNLGVSQPPRRSSNWPLRLRRRGPNGGSSASVPRRAAA